MCVGICFQYITVKRNKTNDSSFRVFGRRFPPSLKYVYMFAFYTKTINYITRKTKNTKNTRKK